MNCGMKEIKLNLLKVLCDHLLDMWGRTPISSEKRGDVKAESCEHKAN
jgi:hypothetical protein